MKKNVLDAFLISGVNLTQHQLQQNIKLYTKLPVGLQQQMKKLKMLFLNPPLIIRSRKIIYFILFSNFTPRSKRQAIKAIVSCSNFITWSSNVVSQSSSIISSSSSTTSSSIDIVSTRSARGKFSLSFYDHKKFDI